MNEQLLRGRIHQAVDTYGAAMTNDPHLAQRIIAQTERKEVPRMKKLSAGAVIAIVLMLLSLTALAVGLTVEEMWKQSFAKMNTSGVMPRFFEPASDEMTMDEAITAARKAIRNKFGTPDEELDSMGLYPTYFPPEIDDGVSFPSQWRIYFSSRTDVDLDYDDLDYGPLGEYRVYMDAKSGAIDICVYYTNDFWKNAQRVWDCGSYDEVYWHYGKPEFYSQSAEKQKYWTQQLADKGYEVRAEEDNLHDLLLAAEIDLLFCDLKEIVTDSALTGAAWDALDDRCGLSRELLQKYAFVATVPDWNNGYDNVCIHFSYEREWNMMEMGFLSSYCDHLFGAARRMGLYMVSFEPGTNNVAAITHVRHSETMTDAPSHGDQLLSRTDWTTADFTAFNEAYARLELAVRRMEAAGLQHEEIMVVVRDFMHTLGAGAENYPAAPEDVDVQQWFAADSEYDAGISLIPLSYEEFILKYGSDTRFWPMEVMMTIDPERFRMPRPDSGELTMEEAIDRALKQLVEEKGQSALDELGEYVIVCHRVSLTDDPEKPDCRWEIRITDDPGNAQNGWRMTFGEWEHHIDKPYVQHITDMSNG